MRWANGWWSSSFLDQTLPWLTYLGSHFAVIFFILLSWILTKQRKSSPSSYSSLCRPIRSHLWPQISDSTTETVFVSGDGLQALQGSGEDSRPEFSQRPRHLFLYDGNPPLLLVPPISNYFLHLAAFIGWTRIYLGVHYPDGCHRRSPAGIWNDKVISQIFSPSCRSRLQFFCFFLLIVSLS